MDLNFGEILHEKRTAKNLTLEALAKQIGVTKGFLSLVENSRRRLSEEQARHAGEILKVEDTETWIFLATKAEIIQNIQKQFPIQFNSLFRERKTKSSIYKKIVEASLETNQSHR